MASVTHTLQEAGLLVDIREAYHLGQGIEEGAIHAPLGKLLAEPDLLPRDRILLLRGHGARDERFAADYLQKQGFDARALRR